MIEVDPKELTFSPNDKAPRHRWYSLNEGFSGSFVRKCLSHANIDEDDWVCDPFSGCGTTAVEVARMGGDGIFYEVNPLLSFASRSKVYALQDPTGFESWATKYVRESDLLEPQELADATPNYTTLRKGNRYGRWLFDDIVLRFVLSLVRDLRRNQLKGKYGLVLLALASCVEEFCNARRDGKAMRYESDWKTNQWTEERLKEKVVERIEKISEDAETFDVPEKSSLRFETRSVLEGLSELPENTIDGVVTSPPYLNSRDYTDLYNPDMWILGFVDSYEESRMLRRECIHSHMQLKRELEHTTKVSSVRDVVGRFDEIDRPKWLKRLPRMIDGYFGEMEQLFQELNRVLDAEGSAYFAVAESAYCGVEINTLSLLGDLANEVGFETTVRAVREIRRSSQQYHDVTLKEGVLILEH